MSVHDNRSLDYSCLIFIREALHCLWIDEVTIMYKICSLIVLSIIEQVVSWNLWLFFNKCWVYLMSSFKSIYWRVRIAQRPLRRPKFCSFKYRSYTKQNMNKISELYTATSRKVVGKSARDNPERYCGWVWVRCSSQKFERMTGEAMDVCLRALKESNKRIFDSYSARNSVLIISNITLSGLSRAHFCRQPFSK